MTDAKKPAKPKNPEPSSRRSAASNAAAAEPESTEVTGALTPQAPTDSSPDHRARFHFFVIDSGWDSAAARVIRENLDMITRFQDQDPLFILTRQQSTALIRRHPHLIGKDPILMARDLQGRGASGGSEYHGFHLNMGLIREPDKAVVALRKFLHLLAAHRHSADIEQDIKALLHRKGLTGAIEVLRSGAEAMAG